ncbi:MAG: DUF11 domain-containing protein [Anaerolineae bacterium]|nr:DUF11 domain-containing protein [Anaerolineae bacterium]
MRIENNRIIGNSYFGNNGNYEGGGGIQLMGQSATVINNTIYGNSSPKGSGIHIAQWYSGRIVNNIVWGNTGSANDDQISIETGYEPGPIPDGLAIHFNDIQDMAIIVVYRNTPQGIEYVDGVGNIDANPLFIDAANGRFDLLLTSPCLDTGTDNGAPADDMEGDPRPLGQGYDIGADESELQLSKQASSKAIQAGDSFTYTIYMTNVTGLDLDTIVTDMLPSGIAPSGVLTWTPMIAAHSSWTQAFIATVGEHYSGTLINIVQVATVSGATRVCTETSTIDQPWFHLYLPLLLRN